MKFQDWWIANKSKIIKISTFWLLPKKLKIIVKIIISAIDIYLASEENETIASVPLKDISVYSDGEYMYLRHQETIA